MVIIQVVAHDFCRAYMAHRRQEAVIFLSDGLTEEAGGAEALIMQLKLSIYNSFLLLQCLLFVRVRVSGQNSGAVIL